MSVLNSDGPPQGESLSPQEPGPPASSDSDPGHLPEGLPEETSQVVEALSFPLRPDMPSSYRPPPTSTTRKGPKVLSLGLPGPDTSGDPDWPGLRTLLQQLPPQDSDERYCLALGDDELAELRLFCAQRRREALGQGVARLVPPKLAEHTCEKCRERLRPGEYGVFAARAGERRRWHPACFACQVCGQTLMNLICFYHDGLLYCGRHHAELLRPRCPACDQLIFSRRCTEAEGRRWHENHFCCQDCAGPLGGGRYALPGGGPCCPSCFESRYSDAGSSQAPTLEGRASLGKGERAAQRGRGSGLGWAEEGILPGWDPRPGPTPSHPSSSAPVPPPHPPDPSLGARSSHRASLAGALQGPPEPIPRHRWGCGAGLAPGLGTRPPSGGRWRGGAGEPGRGVTAAAAARTARGRGGRPDPNWNWLLGPARSDQGEGRLRARRWAFLTRSGTGETRLDRVEGDCALLDPATTSRAALLASASRSSPETQRGLLRSSPEQEGRAGDEAEGPKGRERGRLETPLGAKEDAPCPTCSSSDSEPEGFFLGQRLPGPWKTPGSLQAGDSDTSRKHCTIC
ncbi:prickle-like protein 4 isoform X2 [Ailuropoda melanoleuca]|nr:prickle-like protein 4 isoform X2 [Ailuropoda melanoleuca]XP_034503998.1 prickle-like protein 4 isoform X2 [Ailuropoda melanoleuca]XP_034503999.1 prickle-like protein 4 isoform X2 [Ailuropoda melanoleuca]XP_034504000.1 prickle-like protein 4 isoform X2 [Ailuropoda melanoleuca]XP_034504001.1 prickle-like protein 4 isoform X2 [Ailuropoda melanoleuca]